MRDEIRCYEDDKDTGDLYQEKIREQSHSPQEEELYRSTKF